MGLLDDAIREHLDLKRRRGADPADVARMEQEALGPVRRDPTPAEPAAEAPSAGPSDAPPAEHHADERHPEEHAHELAPEERHDPPHGDPLLEQHAHNVELGGAAAHEPEPDNGDADRAAAPPAEPVVAEDARPPAEGPGGARVGGPDSTGPARQAADPDLVDQPTTEYRVEDHHDDGDEHGQHEDVLEETPDFLQETPEHDRLWFEQRPPRDFDFDG